LQNILNNQVNLLQVKQTLESLKIQSIKNKIDADVIDTLNVNITNT